MTDHDLSQVINKVRLQVNSIAPRLPDGGAKLKANLKRMEDEQNRRNSIRLQKIDLESEKSVHSISQESHSSADHNFDKPFGKKDNGPPPRTNEQQHQPSSNYPPRDNPEQMTDHDLSQAINRARRQINLIAPRLPDGGAWLKANLKRMEDEQNRRNSIRVQKIDLEGEKPVHSISQESHSSGEKIHHVSSFYRGDDYVSSAWPKENDLIGSVFGRTVVRKGKFPMSRRSSRIPSSDLSLDEKKAVARKFLEDLAANKVNASSVQGSDAKVLLGKSGSIKRKVSADELAKVKKVRPSPPVTTGSSKAAYCAGASAVPKDCTGGSDAASPIVILEGDQKLMAVKPTESAPTGSNPSVMGDDLDLQAIFAKSVLSDGVSHPAVGGPPKHFCVSDGVFKLSSELELQALLQLCLMSSKDFVGTLSAENSRLQVEMLELREKLSQAAVSQTKLQNEVELQTKQLADETSKVTNSSKTESELRARILRLVEEKKSLSDQNAALENQVLGLEGKVAGLDGEVSGLRGKVACLETAAGVREDEMAELLDGLLDCQAKLQTYM